MATIEIHGLSKRFGDVAAVDDLSFTAREGAVTGFLGPNGAGKSTTLRMLLGLVRADRGHRHDRRQAVRASSREPFRHVGAVLEADAFHPGRRARDHLRVLADRGRPAARRASTRCSRRSTSPTSADRRVKGFSLGMRQRLGLASALLGEPEVLILDEPANGLDPEGVHWLRRFLRAFADGGGTVLVSSHLLAEVAQTVDDVVIIAHGRLVTQSSLAELADRSRSGVRVRTPQAEALRDGARRAGHRRRARRPPTRSSPWRRTAEAVGLAAAGAGVVIYEMTPEHFDLEEMFLELTDDRRSIPMTNLIHAELLKLRTTRVFWVYVGGRAGVRAGQRRARRSRRAAPAPLDSSRGRQRRRRSPPPRPAALLMLLVIGILMMAGEFRHDTATSTFLITPDRRRVVGAKLAAASLVGFVVGLAASAPHAGDRTALALGEGRRSGRALGRHRRGARSACCSRPRSSPIVGVGFGALVTNQTVAITIALVWTTIVEGLLVSFEPEVGRWLPGGAAAALTGIATPNGGLLPIWARRPSCLPPTASPSPPPAAASCSGGTSHEPRQQRSNGSSREPPASTTRSPSAPSPTARPRSTAPRRTGHRCSRSARSASRSRASCSPT